MTSPLDKANAPTPFWLKNIHDYDGLEIHPVCTIKEQDGTTFEEICEPEEADMWSVYGHLKTGGIECFEDFTSLDIAEVFAETLHAAYPHLRDDVE